MNFNTNTNTVDITAKNIKTSLIILLENRAFLCYDKLIKIKRKIEMAVGFRKSLFGFNSNDVVEYIERAQHNFNVKENALNKKLDEIKEELNRSNSLCEALASEKQRLQLQLDEFNAKYEDMERMSENIGKLYLVAQTNSKAIIENSNNSVKIADAEVERNLNTLSDAHRSLDELRNKITKTSDDFVSEVDNLIASLETTVNQINQNSSAIEDAKKEFAEVFASITE